MTSQFKQLTSDKLSNSCTFEAWNEPKSRLANLAAVAILNVVKVKVKPKYQLPVERSREDDIAVKVIIFIF